MPAAPVIELSGMCAVEQYRLFAAISLPAGIKEKIAATQLELRAGLAGASVTWTKREQLHLTLKFFGNIDVPLVTGLRAKLAAACDGFGPFILRAERLGVFPDARFPRVIWVGLTDDGGKLANLQSSVESASRDFTSQEPEKKFTGHVTLGRIKHINRHDSKKLAELLVSMSDREFGEWTASELELMRSELTSDGARHTSIETFPLSRSQGF